MDTEEISLPSSVQAIDAPSRYWSTLHTTCAVDIPLQEAEHTGKMILPPSPQSGSKMSTIPSTSIVCQITPNVNCVVDIT